MKINGYYGYQRNLSTNEIKKDKVLNECLIANPDQLMGFWLSVYQLKF